MQSGHGYITGGSQTVAQKSRLNDKELFNPFERLSSPFEGLFGPFEGLYSPLKGLSGIQPFRGITDPFRRINKDYAEYICRLGGPYSEKL